MEKGTVFNIQRFCMDDGPGIRTTVFFKGCPLRCQWCHNPESQDPLPRLAYDEKRCIRCGACENACPAGCHRVDSASHTLRREDCTSCGRCASVCPTDSLEISGREYTVDEILEVVRRDKLYYADTGGMTLSGGEPMMQWRFALALAKEAGKEGIHVCMETSGCGSLPAFRELAPYIDSFLFDYKCSPQDYERYTGGDFARIEQNLACLAGLKKEIVLRCPVIRECAGEEHFFGIARLARRYSVRKIELLPYHELGISKCQRFHLPKQKKFHSYPIPFLKEKAAEIEKYCHVETQVKA